MFVVHGPGIAGGSTALAAAVVLPRNRGYITRVGLMKIQKERKKSRCIILYNARVKIPNKSASFTTKCIMATDRVTENV